MRRIAPALGRLCVSGGSDLTPVELQVRPGQRDHLARKPEEGGSTHAGSSHLPAAAASEMVEGAAQLDPDGGGALHQVLVELMLPRSVAALCSAALALARGVPVRHLSSPSGVAHAAPDPPEGEQGEGCSGMGRGLLLLETHFASQASAAGAVPARGKASWRPHVGESCGCYGDVRGRRGEGRGGDGWCGVGRGVRRVVAEPRGDGVCGGRRTGPPWSPRRGMEQRRFGALATGQASVLSSTHSLPGVWAASGPRMALRLSTTSSDAVRVWRGAKCELVEKWRKQLWPHPCPAQWT